MINEMIGHFECNSIEEKNENTYLVLDDIDENKEVSKKYEEVWEDISNDDLPLNKPIKLLLLTIIISSIFSENGKFYPQLFLNDALYEL